MQAPRETLRRRLFRRRHTALLVAIVTVFAVRPLVGDAGVGPLLFSLSVLGLFLMALFTVQAEDLMGDRERLIAHRRRQRVIAWALILPAVAERVCMFVAPSPRLYLIGVLSWFLFFSFVTWSQLRSLLKHKTITGETISMSISIYLLLGLTWSLLYALMFHFNPGAFDLGAQSTMSSGAVESEIRTFPVLMYFSLTTISTVGFGDITPLTLQARYAAVAEGITGQFYLAILVARLVAMHLSAVASTKGRG